MRIRHGELPPIFLAPSLWPTACRTFAAAAVLSANRDRGRKRRLDGAVQRKIKLRNDTHNQRRDALREQRAIANGDPIRGIDTPFVRSFDVAKAEAQQEASSAKPDSVHGAATTERMPDTDNQAGSQGWNMLSPNMTSAFVHGISRDELSAALSRSRQLNSPMEGSNRASDTSASQHSAVSEAVHRIVALGNANSQYRTKDNIRRIIDTFGRHHTDHVMQPRPASLATSASAPKPTPRCGPDTGSSEVQIAILTAKIRVLADRYAGENKNDKINKRNLRLLVHRRQKLLKYMYRKERGSDRWQHMISTLGLTPATWEGEIQF